MLQIPLEEVRPGSSSTQPHTLVPANLLLTTLQSMGPAPSLAPLALYSRASSPSLDSVLSGQASPNHAYVIRQWHSRAQFRAAFLSNAVSLFLNLCHDLLSY